MALAWAFADAVELVYYCLDQRLLDVLRVLDMKLLSAVVVFQYDRIIGKR